MVFSRATRTHPPGLNGMPSDDRRVAIGRPVRLSALRVFLTVAIVHPIDKIQKSFANISQAKTLATTDHRDCLAGLSFAASHVDFLSLFLLRNRSLAFSSCGHFFSLYLLSRLVSSKFKNCFLDEPPLDMAQAGC